jgi:hypothetical protein
VYNNNLENGYRAFAERYYMCKTEAGFQPALPVEPTAFVGDSQLREFMSLLLANLELAPIATTREVVNAYIGSKRKVYERAEREYYDSGVLGKHAHLNSFVKFEKQDLSKAPRVINPRDPVYNLALGKYLKFNEKRYFSAIADVFGQSHTVIKGMDIEAQASSLKECFDGTEECVVVGGDASKFDMHVSREALEYEHLAYLMPYFDGTLDECLKAYRAVQQAGLKECPDEEGFLELAWLLAQQLDNTGTAYFDDGVLKFANRGTRASGDLNTSLGNCIIMCGLNWSWSRRVGVTSKLGNNGDDCVTFLRRCDLPVWEDGQVEFYASKGFRMVLEEPVYEFEEVEFCQSKPVQVGGVYRMVRNPTTLITKASMCVRPCSSINLLKKWVMAVGVCEGSLSGGVPVLDAFARALRRNGKKCSAKMVKVVKGDTSRTITYTHTGGIDAETRHSFYIAWGISPAE